MLDVPCLEADFLDVDHSRYLSLASVGRPRPATFGSQSMEIRISGGAIRVRLESGDRMTICGRDYEHWDLQFFEPGRGGDMIQMSGHRDALANFAAEITEARNLAQEFVRP